jgi:ferrochelatase
MRLENILALTHGKLVSKPFVSNFENIIFDAKAVKRGDIFIAFDESSIQDAIFNGAYGILFEGPTQITDSEIAWIKVKEIKTAIKRLLRFKLIEKEVQVYECNEIILKLALQVVTEPNFIAISDDSDASCQSLWNIEPKSTLLFSPEISSSEIYADSKSLPKTAMMPISIIEQTLFETSFIYNDIFYERQLISPFFIPYLEELLHLFYTLKINFRLRKFTPIEHFEAVFTNKKLEVKEFGTSDKVLIFEKNTSLIASEIEYLKKSASWANIIYIIPASIAEEFKENENIFTYRHEREIRIILKDNSFHFALIAGVDKEILRKPLLLDEQPTLF